MNTHAAAIAAALLALAAPGAADCGENPAPRLTTASGRLVIAQGPADYEASSPDGYFKGGIEVHASDDCLSLECWRREFHDWQVIDLKFSQAPATTTVSYTVRTPPDMPDWRIELEEPNPTLLLIRHPEVTMLLDEALASIGSGPFRFDPIVAEQLHPSPPQQALAATVAGLVKQLGAGDWRDRDAAERHLGELGPAAILLLLDMDREDLSAEQNARIDSVAARYPILTAEDREACRREPMRLATPARMDAH